MFDDACKACFLIEDLVPANNCCKMPARVFQSRTQEINFLLHEETCHTREIVCYALCRGVCAMSCPESIIDVDLTERGKLAGKIQIVLFFFFLGAEIFPVQNLSPLQSCN